MSANVKLVCQSWGMWCMLLVGFPYCIHPYIIMFRSDSPETGAGHFASYLLPVFIVGIWSAGMQMVILAKPFVFSLPGHHEMVRGFLFRIGWLVSLLYSSTFLVYPAGTVFGGLILIGSGTLMGMTAYLLGVCFIFGIPWGKRGTGFFCFAILILMLFDMHIFLESTIVNHPLMTLLMASSVAIVTWKKLGDGMLARTYARQLHTGTGHSLNTEKGRKRRRMRDLDDKPRDIFYWRHGSSVAVDNYFLSRMSSYAPLGTGRYVWGAVSEVVRIIPLASAQWWKLWPGVLILSLWGYYAGTMGGAVNSSIFILPSAFGLAMALSVRSTMLLPAGRRERFWGGVATGFGAGACAMLITVLFAVITQGLQYVLPTVTLRGIVFAYLPIEMRDVFLPLLLGPIFSLPAIGAASRAMIVVCAFCFGVLIVTMRLWLPFLHNMGPLFIGLLVVVAWLLSAAFLYYTCARKDLVTQ